MRRVSVCLCLAVALTVTGLFPMRTTRAATVHLAVTPNPAPADQPVMIRLSGLAPDEPAMLSAQFVDATGSQWEAEAAFRADGRGVVDPATQAPLAGAYSGVQPMGLLWSATLNGGGASPRNVNPHAAESLAVSATVAGQIVARATQVRYVVAPGVTATAVRTAGLYGALYHPVGGAPAPGVLVLGGSEGGLSPYLTREAALLADHGYAALALAYFGAPGLPHALTNIPLEYFGRALGWLGRQPGVRGDRLAVLGHSRGGELALLVGAHYPQLTAVVSYVGSGVVFASPTVRGAAAWTWQGRPLASRTTPPVAGEPIVSQPQTTIPVERINGPVLLLAAADDQLWPSAALSRVALDRLHHDHHPYADQLVVYPGAGHLMQAPYLPTVLPDAAVIAYGGDAKDQAAADVDAWRRVLRLLGARLQPMCNSLHNRCEVAHSASKR